MLEVREALELVLAHSQPLKPRLAHALMAGLGRVLVEDAVSDIDMPPFDKAMMDGYAVRAADCAEGPVEFEVIETVHAGGVPQRSVGPRQATEIMTGAPLPEGANVVIMVERSVRTGNRVTFGETPTAGQNVMPRGKELQKGQTAIEAGTLLRAPELGLLALVGVSMPVIVPAPQVAILATGDELVEASYNPGPGQIRNSNGPMLTALAFEAGADAKYLGIARDDRESLRAKVAEGLQADVLILSGGVSAGKLDLVPEILAELGVQPIFHKLRMKPGKPLYFGTLGAKLIFGLPGNPGSSFVGFELFVQPALRRLMGRSDVLPMLEKMRAGESFHHRADRPTYHPALATYDGDAWGVTLVAWAGSPDLRAISQANALAVLPAGPVSYAAGDAVEVIRWSR